MTRYAQQMRQKLQFSDFFVLQVSLLLIPKHESPKKTRFSAIKWNIMLENGIFC